METRISGICRQNTVYKLTYRFINIYAYEVPSSREFPYLMNITTKHYLLCVCMYYSEVLFTIQRYCSLFRGSVHYLEVVFTIQM